MIPAKATSLHHVPSAPPNRSEAVFVEYPGFKMGVMRSVRHYADRLKPLVDAIVATGAGWTITAPAIAARTPSAANLLCWELHRQSAGATTLVDIRHQPPLSGTMGWKDPAKPLDYARLDAADRVRERDRFNRHMTDHVEFRGRPVLFVNDISVTGAQQLGMEDYFRRVGAGPVHWLYILTVDPEIGRSNPRIEWEINFAPFEDLLDMVAGQEIVFTGKCVQRLMHLDEGEFSRLLNALDPERREQLAELAVLNGYADLEEFAPNLKRLASLCSEDRPRARRA